MEAVYVPPFCKSHQPQYENVAEQAPFGIVVLVVVSEVGIADARVRRRGMVRRCILGLELR